MPIYNTTLVAPVAKVAPLSSNPVSRENSTLGAAFGEILSDQNQLLPQTGASVTGDIDLLEGGQLLQPGGNNLPEVLTVTTTTTTTTPTPTPTSVAIATVDFEIVSEPATVANPLSLPVADVAPHASGINPFETLPDSEQLLVETVDQLPPAAPLINPEAYDLVVQGVGTPGPEGNQLAVRIVGDRVAISQGVRLDVRTEDAGIVLAPVQSDEALPNMMRAISTGAEQSTPKSFLDLGVQSRQAQLAGNSVESNIGILESLVGRDLNQAKLPVPIPVLAQEVMALPVGQTDGSMAVKMATGSAVTMTPGVPNWNNEFAARVSTVVKNGVQEASLQLNPPELGRLEIKVTTEGDQTKILFNVQNMAAKDAIEQAMPRLREMLEQDGLQLAHSEVSDQSTPEHGDREEASTALPNLSRDRVDENRESSSPEMAVIAPDALVDYYI